jgi:hypothetical protein
MGLRATIGVVAAITFASLCGGVEAWLERERRP